MSDESIILQNRNTFQWHTSLYKEPVFGLTLSGHPGFNTCPDWEGSAEGQVPTSDWINRIFFFTPSKELQQNSFPTWCIKNWDSTLISVSSSLAGMLLSRGMPWHVWQVTMLHTGHSPTNVQLAQYLFLLTLSIPVFDSLNSRFCFRSETFRAGCRGVSRYPCP